MTTTPTHWIAGTLGITPVVILETGTGGQDLSFVPPDPVVVRSVEDYFEFVASEGALFTDKGLATKESHRLLEQQASKARAQLSKIECHEVLEARALLARAEQESKYIDSLPDEPEIIEDNTLGSPHPVVEMKVSSPPTIGAKSSGNPVEVVVTKKKKPAEGATKAKTKKLTPEVPSPEATEGSEDTPKSEENTKPKCLLDCIVYVIGRETISFDEICKRLEAREWFPKRRSSVSNVLSAHKNQFHIPEKGMYSLRSKPVVSPVESDEASRAVKTVSVSSEVSEEPEGVESPGEDFTDEEPEAVLAPVASAEPEHVEKSASEFDTWLGKPMTHLNPNRAHYHDEEQGVIFTERFNMGFWTAEIHIEGLDTWPSGTSKDRREARAQAQISLNIKVKTVNDHLDKVPGLLDPKFFPS